MRLRPSLEKRRREGIEKYRRVKYPRTLTIERSLIKRESEIQKTTVTDVWECFIS